MRVALISTYSSFPIGLRYIASFLESQGHEVSLVHMKNSNHSHILQWLKTDRPDVLGLTCYTQDIWKVLDVIPVIKLYSPQTKIVLGNIHATVFYREILNHFPQVDFVVLGEGEIPMKELLEHLKGQKQIDDVPNIAYRNGAGQIIKTRPLEELPPLDTFSDYLVRPLPHSLLFLRYRWFRSIFKRIDKSLENTLRICSSRGCPYPCSYCSESFMTHHRWRAHSPAKTVDIMENFSRNYNATYFAFEDPCFSIDKERVKNICAEIRNRKLNVKWGFRAHVCTIDEELIPILREAGCITFTADLDCLTDEMMRKHRGIRIDYARLTRVMKAAKRLKITVSTNVIAGWPESRFRDVFETVKIIKKLRPTHICIYALRYFPGTRMTHEAVNKGILDAYGWLDENKDPLPLAISRKGKVKLKDMIKLRAQQVILGLAFIFYSRNINGIMYFSLTIFADLTMAYATLIKKSAFFTRRCLLGFAKDD